jgi:hypothetical protein
MRNVTPTKLILNGATAVKGAASNGNGLPMDVEDFQHVVIALDTTGSTTATVKIQASISQAVPDFTAAASPTNQWAYVQAIDLADQSVINGAVGIGLTGTDMDRMVEVNTNGVKWVNVIVTAYTQGTIYASAKAFNTV